MYRLIPSQITMQRAGFRFALVFFGLLAVCLPGIGSANDFCPNVYKGGKFRLNFNPAFTHIDSFKHPDGNSYDGLLVSSFYNVIKDSTGTTTTGYFQRDLVARITGIGWRAPRWFNATRDTEILSDLDEVSPTMPSDYDQTNWFNEVQKLPDGILTFEAALVPEVFHPATPADLMP